MVGENQVLQKLVFKKPLLDEIRVRELRLLQPFTKAHLLVKGCAAGEGGGEAHTK